MIHDLIEVETRMVWVSVVGKGGIGGIGEVGLFVLSYNWIGERNPVMHFYSWLTIDNNSNNALYIVKVRRKDFESFSIKK
jgi:hypothetical protein